MRIVRTCLVLSVLIGGFALPAAPASAGSSQRMLNEINRIRAAHGVRPINRAENLVNTSVGMGHAMMAFDFFGHLPRLGVSRRYRHRGEILALNSGRRLRIRGTVRAWLRSPAHRGVVLDGSFAWAGAAATYDRMKGRRRTVWVAHFGGR